MKLTYGSKNKLAGKVNIRRREKEKAHSLMFQEKHCLISKFWYCVMGNDSVIIDSNMNK